MTLKTFSELSLIHTNSSDSIEKVRKFYSNLLDASGIYYQKITPFSNLMQHMKAVQCALSNRGEQVAHIPRKFFEFAKNYLENLSADGESSLIDGDFGIFTLSIHDATAKKNLLKQVNEILTLSDSDILSFFVQITSDDEYERFLRSLDDAEKEKIKTMVEKWENE